jgi:glycosyltransferase involved in cell wall biosynthesis
MKECPLVSVVLPCYNAELFIEQALNSITNQSYQNLEIIVIDDASDDNSGAIVLKIAKLDSRIVYIRNKDNLKLIRTLNLGIDIAKGKYFARMDADDIAHPDRIKYQVEALESDDSAVICGAGIISVDSSGHTHNRYYPLMHDEIIVEALFNSVFAHPCVIMRMDNLIRNNLRYNEHFPYAEDYHLWQHILETGKAVNLPYFLLTYRILNSGQTSKGVSDEQKRFEIISNIQKIGLEKIGCNFSEKEKQFQYTLSLSKLIRDINFDLYSIEFIKSHFNKIEKNIISAGYSNVISTRYVLGKIYLKVTLFNIKRLKSKSIKLILCRRIFWGLIYTINCKLKYSKV